MNLLFTPSDRDFRRGWFSPPRTASLLLEGTPAQMHGLRALFVSDVHLRECVDDAALGALIDQMRDAHADILLLGGDYGETEADCLRFFDALHALRFPLGGFAVCGNNDRMPEARLRSAMQAAGITLLKNAEARVSLPCGALCIAGCDDHKHGNPRTRDLFAQAEGYRLLLSHYPVAPDCRFDLMLSGHTHAGQVNIGGLTPYSVGYELHRRLRAVRGWRVLRNNGLLFVGNGIGVSKLPLRIGARPEIYALTFG